MSDFYVAITIQDKEKKRVYDFGCTISTLPKKDDLIGLENTPSKSFKTCLAQIKNVLRIIYPAEGSFQNKALIVAEILYTSDKSITVEAIAK